MVLKNDRRQPVPEWLANLKLSSLRKSIDLPLTDILRRFLYYPASGLDGRPVQCFWDERLPAT
jgi:hypothetical protein